MSRQMNSPMSHVVVACGGSGAKSALRLAQLLAQDPQWRHEMDESVYFLLVDTDAGDLEKYEQSIRAATPRGVYVASLLTSRGFRAPYEIVQEFKAGIEAGMTHQPSSLARFAEHWWVRNPEAHSFDEAGVLQVAHVDDITAGAGQVPAVSFLATWQAMVANKRAPMSVESVLESLFERMGNVRAPIAAGDAKPLEQFNIMFLGSVAGGTGRGCAIPIAFKMKEVLSKKLGGYPRISGYFLNEDCFVQRRQPHETLPQILNAMTGWSELSAWMHHFEAEHRGDYAGMGYRYSLPGLVKPEDADYDALGELRRGSASGEIGAARPFDAIGVIGRQSASGFTAQSDDIYAMLAAALYVRITQSHVQSTASNDGRRYFSVGSSVIEVPYDDLKKYFVDRARLDAGNRVNSELTATAAEQEAAKILEGFGLGNNAVVEFLATRPGQDPVSPFQRLAVDLGANGGVIADRMQPLLLALEEQDLERAREELARALSEADLDDLARSVARQHTRLLCAVLTEKLGYEISGVGAVADAIVEQLIGTKASLLARLGSARAVAQVARRVIAKLNAAVDAGGAFSTEAVQAWQQQAGRNANAELEAARKREGLLGLAGKRFSEEEILGIKSATESELRCLCVRALGKALGSRPQAGDGSLGLFKAIESKLAALEKNAALVGSATRELLGDSGVSPKLLQETEERLFSGEHLERSIPVQQAGSTTYMLRRQVRPLKPDPERTRLDSPKLVQTIRQLMLPESEEPSGVQSALRIAKAIDGALKESRFTYLLGGEAGEVPIMEVFGLREVLRALAVKWAEYLTRLRAQDYDRYREVAQAFRNFFGIEPRETESKVTLHSGPGVARLMDAAGDDYLMLAMATVAARTCRPFWRTASDRGETPHVTVQIPIVSDKLGEWKNVIRDDANLPSGSTDPVTVIGNHDQGAVTGFNRYLMVVYTSSGASSLDDVSTLGSWSENPTIRRVLELAERTDVALPFRPVGEVWPGYRGSGFTDPVYVHNRQLRTSRWRPWAKDIAESTEREQRADLMMALAYAWVGPEWFLRNALGASGDKTQGPIFTFGKRASIRVVRRPVKFAEGFQKSQPFQFQVRQADNFHEMPSPGTEVASSLDQLLEVISPNAGGGQDSMRGFRDGILAEYQSYLEAIADPAGFHPEHDRKGFARVTDMLKQYVGERLDGKLTDPEHPARSEELRDDRDAEGSRTSKAFWKAVGQALTALGKPESSR